MNRAIGTPEIVLLSAMPDALESHMSAGMIDAYYSLGSDSSKLFEDTRIASDPDYEKYRNKYNVIHLDISSFWDFHKKGYCRKDNRRYF